MWINEPLDGDIFSPPDDIDHDTIQYFNDLFEKQGISIEDDQRALQGVNLQANCSGNTPGISVSCLNSIYPPFCKEVEADLSKGLTKSYTGLESTTNSRIARPGMMNRRILMKRNTCDKWTFQLSWSGPHGKCNKSCSKYFGIIGEQCIKDKSSNKGSLDVGCGTYNLEVKTASKTATTKSETFSPNPTNSSYRPLVVGAAVCEGEANLPGHAPINEEHQGQLASIACLRLNLVHHISFMNAHSIPMTYSANPDGTNYFYSVSWIDGCETAVESQDPYLPLGNDLSPLCSYMFTWAYDWCKYLITRIN